MTACNSGVTRASDPEGPERDPPIVGLVLT